LLRVNLCRLLICTSDVCCPSNTRKSNFSVPNRIYDASTFFEHAKSSVDDVTLLNSPILSSQDPTVTSLDYVPRTHLASFVRNFQATLVPGAPATLEFTTRGHSVKILDKSFILSILPFLPRRYVDQGRMSTMLFIPLHQVIELLTTTNDTSGHATLAISSVQNVSENYAIALDTIAITLQDHRKVRDSFVRKWGMQGWREQMFWMVWEAALFKLGFLQRWVIVIRKQS
jgi:hypothetical protein